MRHIAIVAAAATVAFADCQSIDFNRNGVFPEDADYIAMLDALAGAEPPAGQTWNSIDFNGDGVFPDDADVTAYLAVLAGGPCPTTGWTPITQSGPRLRVGPGETIASVYRQLRWSGGVIEIPFASREGGVFEEAIRWPDEDGLPFGNVTFVGVPGPNGERPIIRPPFTSSAGARITAPNISIRGVQIECSHCLAGIDITGGALRTLVEDVVIVGSAFGIRIQGDNFNGGPVSVRRSIIRDTLGRGSHSQGVYIAGWRQIVLVEECVFFNIGEETTFNQCIYAVHGPGLRVFINNWFYDPGFAGIQARGSNDEYTITGNVFEQCGNGIGVGHPMGRVFPVRGIVARNLIMKPKRPFWGIALQNGDGATVTDNTLLASGAGYAFQIENPSRSLTVKGNTISRWDRVRNYASGVSATNDGIDWQGDTLAVKRMPEIDWQMLLSRKAGEWDAERHATAGVIEGAKFGRE